MIRFLCYMTLASLLVMQASAQAAVWTSLSSETDDVWTIQGDKGEKVGTPVPHLMSYFGQKGYDTDFSSTVFTYERVFDLPANVAALPRKFIRFERSNWRTTVLLNGEDLGTHNGGFHSFEMDVTEAVKRYDNRLRVIVEDYHHVLNESKKAEQQKDVVLGLLGHEPGWNYTRGISDHVYILGRNEVYLDEWYAWGIVRGETSPKAGNSQTINSRTTITNTSNKDRTVEILYTFRSGDRTEKRMRADSLTVPAGDTVTLETNAPWNDARLWWPHDPFLYDATVSLELDGQIVDTETFKFGFRDFYCRNTRWERYKDESGAVIADMWLNGKRIRLRGDTAITGRTAYPKKHVFTERMWEGDGFEELLRLAQANNLNALRFNCEAAPKACLEIADRMGMLVIHSSPFKGRLNGIEKYSYDINNPELWRMAREQIAGIVKDVRRHPSVVLWAADNEVSLRKDERGRENLAAIVDVYNREDPSREVMFEGGETYMHPFNPRLFIVNSHYRMDHPFPNRTELPEIAPWSVRGYTEKAGLGRLTVEQIAELELDDLDDDPTSPLSGSETLRTANRWPYSMGEYFWTAGKPVSARPQIYGGFASTEPWFVDEVAARLDAKMTYQITMNYRTFRNWDHFGYLAALSDKDGVKLPALKEAYRPVVVYCRNHNDAFFHGTKIKRELVVMNDTLSDAPVTLKVSASDAEGRAYFEKRKTFDLPAGELAETIVEFPAPDSGNHFTFTYDLLRDGQTVEHNVRTNKLFSRQSLAATTSTVFCSRDTQLAALADDLTSAVTPMDSLTGLDESEARLLLVGDEPLDEDEDAAVRSFLAGGGTVICFSEDDKHLRAPAWLDVPLKHDLRPFARMPFRYSVAFKDPTASGPVADAIIDTDLLSAEINSTEPYGDLRFWGNGNLVARKCIRMIDDPRFEPIVRVTDGRTPDMPNVLLAKIKQGDGTVWYSNLLLLEKYDESPQAAKLLALLLEADIDKYGGFQNLSGTRTGYFHVEKIKGRWWFVSPDGNGMVSIGQNHTEWHWIERHGPQGDLAQTFPDRLNYPQHLLPFLKKYGFNTLGYGTAPSTRGAGFPYVIEFRFAPITAYWKEGVEFPDVFDPEFADFCRAHVRKKAFDKSSGRQTDPWLLGYYYGDLPLFDLHHAQRMHKKDWVDTLRRSDGAGFIAYTEFLKSRYENPQAAGAAYGLNLSEWADIRRHTDALVKKRAANSQLIKDDTEFLGEIARVFYRTCHDVIREFDTNHLILGHRHNRDWPPDIVCREMAPFVDVVAVQIFSDRPFPGKILERYHSLTDRPVMICDRNVNWIQPGQSFPKMPRTMEEALSDYEEMWRIGLHETDYFIGFQKCQLVDLVRDGTIHKIGFFDAECRFRKDYADGMNRVHQNVSSWIQEQRIEWDR